MNSPIKRFLSISLTVALHLPVALAQTPDTSTLVFNAKITVAGTELTGIAIMKRENARCRVLFTTVAGPKLLDMYVDAGGHELLYAVKKLKRKKLLKFLQKTFALITGVYLASPDRECSAAECRVSLPKRDEARYLFDDSSRIVAAEYLHKNKPVFKSEWHYSSDTLEYILLQHPAVTFRLTGIRN
jgi:hypothetical protein